MKKILLISHGKLASGMKNSVEMIVGKKSNLYAIDTYLDDSTIDFTFEIEEFIDKNSSDNQLIILTDIYGGSVNQKVIEVVCKKKLKPIIITGMNLPIVLSLVLGEENLSFETVKEMVSMSTVQVVEIEDLEDDVDLNSFFEKKERRI